MKDFGSIRQEEKYFKIGHHESINEWKKYRCEECSVEVNGKHEWEEHLKSRRHKGKLSKKDRKKEIEKRKNRQGLEFRKEEEVEGNQENQENQEDNQEKIQGKKD